MTDFDYLLLTWHEDGRKDNPMLNYPPVSSFIKVSPLQKNNINEDELIRRIIVGIINSCIESLTLDEKIAVGTVAKNRYQRRKELFINPSYSKKTIFSHYLQAKDKLAQQFKERGLMN